MATISNQIISNETPAADAYGLIVRPIGGSGGGDVTIVAPLGQQPMADSVSVAIADDQTPLDTEGVIVDGVNPAIRATVQSFAFINPLSTILTDPVSGLRWDPVRVTSAGSSGISGSSPAFTGQIAASEFPCVGVCGVAAIYLLDGGFDGEIRVVGGPEGVQAPIDLVYNATDDIVVSGGLPLNKLLLVPVGGFATVALYITIFNSGFFDFFIQAGPGTLNMPKVLPLIAEAPAAISVGVVSTAILAANAARKSARIVNTSLNRVSLAFGAPAVLDSGMTLYPGGAFNMDRFDYNTAAINGIASAAASNVGVQEFT